MKAAIELNEIRDLARVVRLLDVTQSELSQELGVSQSQISRVLSGRIKRRSWLFEKLCEYAYSHPSRMHGSDPSIPKLPPALLRAVSAAWDGSESQARYLADVIESVARLCNTGKNEE